LLLKNQIKIIDNFLDSTEARMVESSLDHINWNLSTYPSTVAPHKYLSVINKNKNIKEYIQFNHSLLDDFGKPENSPLLFLSEFMKEKIKSITNVNNFFRMKVNLLTQCSFSNKEFHNTPHLDRTSGEEYFAGVYYVNDSDGDTFFFNREGNDFIIYKRVEHKKGRLVLFDGNIYHTGRHPKEAIKRIVINFNFN
jgi:hypothetical protein